MRLPWAIRDRCVFSLTPAGTSGYSPPFARAGPDAARGAGLTQSGYGNSPMSLEVGIVGLPNVGKSTIFNALTAAGALAANYPFATIEPNVGVVPVPDDRLH